MVSRRLSPSSLLPFLCALALASGGVAEEIPAPADARADAPFATASGDGAPPATRGRGASDFSSRDPLLAPGSDDPFSSSDDDLWMTLDEAAGLLEPESVEKPAGSLEDSRSVALLRALTRFYDAWPPFWHQGLADLQRGRVSGDGIWVLALLAGFLVLLAIAQRLTQGRGSIAVNLDYPAGLRGTFYVRVSSRSVGETRKGRYGSPAEAQRARRGAARAGQSERYGVSRETQFLRVPCRRHFVCVDGYLQTPESEDVVTAHFAEQEVLPKRGDCAHLSFDFQPRACPVEVRVVWDKHTLEEARVARFGAPGSLRLVRGPVQYSVDRGSHRFVAGSTDRVAEVELEIDSFEPRVLVIDLGKREQLLFTGCPRAMEPYLNGDVATAARHLEREGQSRVANLMLARFHRDHDHAESAAHHFELAGDFASAAELHESLEHYAKAGRLFEQAGQDERAGEMYQSAGELVQAGEAFERADAYDSAVQCFRSAGETKRWIEALSKQGEHLAAAQVAMEASQRTLAIQCLNRISVSGAEYPRAVLMLADAYRDEGHLDLAARKLEELMATRSDDEVPNEALDQLADLCEQTRDHERALQLLERLRMRDAAWPDVATRIDALRRARSSRTTAPDAPATNALVAEGFGDDFRYEILDEVGRGGMGIVFRARDRRLGREVALKRLPDNIRNHPKAIQLFLREARAAAALNHPNIVTLFDAGQEGDTLYITMELLQGHPLQKLLHDSGQLGPSAVAKIGGQVATGLQYAHEQGIVHRDIKTANLFFTDKRVVKIMDFGLAKMVEEVRRSTTVIGGTPYYMAPEQSAGEQVDHRADLYALGVTFFELLAGRVPFKDGDVAFHHRHSPAPDLRDLVPDTPPALAELVAGLLAKKPAERVRSAREVVRRLSEIARSL